jgi:hypothetical protein
VAVFVGLLPPHAIGRALWSVVTGDCPRTVCTPTSILLRAPSRASAAQCHRALCDLAAPLNRYRVSAEAPAVGRSAARAHPLIEQHAATSVAYVSASRCALCVFLASFRAGIGSGIRSVFGIPLAEEQDSCQGRRARHRTNVTGKWSSPADWLGQGEPVSSSHPPPQPLSHRSPGQRRESWKANLARSRPLDLRAQDQVASVLRTDTPTHLRASSSATLPSGQQVLKPAIFRRPRFTSHTRRYSQLTLGHCPGESSQQGTSQHHPCHAPA